MKYVFQKRPLSVESNRVPSRRCHSDRENSWNLELQDRDLNYLSTMRKGERKDFIDICEDESLMEYLNSETGRMKEHIIECNQHYKYMVWQDHVNRENITANYTLFNIHTYCRQWVFLSTTENLSPSLRKNTWKMKTIRWLQ